MASPRPVPPFCRDVVESAWLKRPKMRGLNAGAAIVHRHTQPVGELLGRDLHHLALGREFGGVGEQVRHHLEQPLVVGGDLARRELAARLEAHLEALAEALVEDDRFAHQLVDADHLRIQGQLTRLDLLDVEDIVDQVEQALAVSLRDLGELAHVLRHLAEHARVDELQRADDRGKGRAQLV